MSAPSHPIRRRERALDGAEALRLLQEAEWGVLATVDEVGWPYAVPVNHALVDGALIIHCATEGHKLANLAFNSKVSYCAVTQAETMPQELATRYASVIVFGRVELLTDEGEKRVALRALGLRFAGGIPTWWIAGSTRISSARRCCASASSGQRGRRTARTRCPCGPIPRGGLQAWCT